MSEFYPADEKERIERIFDGTEKLEGLTAAERIALVQSVDRGIHALDTGELSVVTRREPGSFQINTFAKKLILVYFRLRKVTLSQAGDYNFCDKIPVKKWNGEEGVRVVPPAFVRVGSFIERGAILMPSYVNIGARVGSGTLVDTWATVGSCAWIGKNCHLSGGVGIGGVLEPVQASPVIIEDDVFVGSRAIIVEGVHVEAGAVIGAGVTLTASTRIIDVSGSTPVTLRGRVPTQSVVIPGSITKDFPAGSYGVSCALIIGKRKASTDLKTSLNDALREFEVSI